jgi:hypothetical protein
MVAQALPLRFVLIVRSNDFRLCPNLRESDCHPLNLGLKQLLQVID